MKKLFINFRLFFSLLLVFFLFGFSGGGAGGLEKGISASGIGKEKQDCMQYLKQENNILAGSDADGVLDPNQVEQYETCVQNVAHSLDLTNIHNYIFLVDCYSNLMEFYEYINPDEEKLEEYEQLMFDISQE